MTADGLPEKRIFRQVFSCHFPTDRQGQHRHCGIVGTLFHYWVHAVNPLNPFLNPSHADFVVALPAVPSSLSTPVRPVPTLSSPWSERSLFCGGGGNRPRCGRHHSRSQASRHSVSPSDLVLLLRLATLLQSRPHRVRLDGIRGARGADCFLSPVTASVAPYPRQCQVYG